MLRAFAAAGKFYALAEPTYCYRIGDVPVNWTTQKVYDLLCGIEDNLRFSAEHCYARVHCLNYNRLCRDFCGPIVSTALSADGEGKILKKTYRGAARGRCRDALRKRLFYRRRGGGKCAARANNSAVECAKHAASPRGVVYKQQTFPPLHRPGALARKAHKKVA